MITKESLQAIAKVAKLNVDELEKAITSEEEVNLEVPQLNVFTAEELQTYEQNILKENQGTYEEAKKAGAEIKFKEIRDQFGIGADDPIAQGKDYTKLINGLIGMKIKEAGAEPDKKVMELTNDLEELRGQLTTTKQTYEQQLQEKENLLSQQKIDNLLYSKMPDELPQGINKSDALTILKNNIAFQFEDDKLVAKRNGEVLKNDLKSPKGIDEIITEFTTEKGWGKNGGRGSGEGYTGKVKDFKTTTELIQHMKSNGIDPTSEDGKKMVEEFQQSK